MLGGASAIWLPNRVGNAIVFMPGRPGNVVPPLHRFLVTPTPYLGSTDAQVGYHRILAVNHILGAPLTPEPRP